MQEIKFRLVNPGLNPRSTKLEMPGWAGQPEPQTFENWRCLPFRPAKADAPIPSLGTPGVALLRDGSGLKFVAVRCQ
jgi:hypothetical protein